jgi:hypothetical protein
MKSRLLVWGALAVGVCTPAWAWDYAGHRLVNQVALAALPPDFPAFVHTPANAERVAFLAGEPDRWRNAPDLPLQHVNGMDHYLDSEEITEAGLDFATLPSFRYDFAVLFAAGRSAHPQNFPPIDPAHNADHSREWPGFAPWAIAEQYGKLRSAFSYLRVYRELGTESEIQSAEANIVYIMGVMGHYVGDCAQPLHATIHHHGWVGPNPNGYTTWPGIHAWIDGGLIAKAGIKLDELTPNLPAVKPLSIAPRPDGRDPVFVAALDFLLETQKQVEPLYALHKAGKLGDRPEHPVSDEARRFIDQRLVSGGEMLAVIWTTAWKDAVEDSYLRKSLQGRHDHATKSGHTADPKAAAPATAD